MPVPVTVAVVAPAVPDKLTSPVVKPVTASLNTTVKLIGETVVGSGCAAAWLMVTVGGGTTIVNVTVLSVLVEARFPAPPAFTATPAGTVAITVPLVVIPVTATLYVVPLPVTVAVVAPAVPDKLTSPVVKPVTVSLNTTVKLIGETVVGSGCAAA